MTTDVPINPGSDPSKLAGNTDSPVEALSTQLNEAIESGVPIYQYVDSVLKGEGVSAAEQAAMFTVAVEAQRRYVIGDLAETLAGESIPRVEALREYESDVTDRDADTVMEAADHWRELVGRLRDGSNPDNISSALYHGQNDFETSVRPLDSKVRQLGTEAREQTDAGASMLRALSNRTESAAVLDAKAKWGKDAIDEHSDAGETLPDLSEYVSLSMVSNVLEQAKETGADGIRALLEGLLRSSSVDFQHIDAQVRDLRASLDITLDSFAKTVSEFGGYFRERIGKVMPEQTGYLSSVDQAIRANPDGAHDDIDAVISATSERNRAISDVAGTLRGIKKYLTDELDRLRDAA